MFWQKLVKIKFNLSINGEECEFDQQNSTLFRYVNLSIISLKNVCEKIQFRIRKGTLHLKRKNTKLEISQNGTKKLKR